jgi:hypothetical protein
MYSSQQDENVFLPAEIRLKSALFHPIRAGKTGTIDWRLP